MSQVRIEGLTKEQEEQLLVYREKWLGIGLKTGKTGKTDRAEAERIIDDVYKAGGLQPPTHKVWGASPCEGYQMADTLMSRVPGYKRHEEVQSGCWLNSDGDNVEVSEQCGYGSFDASWLSRYDYFGEVCGIECSKGLQPLIALASVCGWWWPFENCVVLTDLPTAIFRDDENRLHHESGMAIRYSDGWGLYSWHGVTVPERVILHPEQITMEEISKEDNAEFKRILLERYGLTRYLMEINASVVHEDERGSLLETAAFAGWAGEDPVARYVLVQDTDTYRQYALRVDPITKTATEGVASTFKMLAEEYMPIEKFRQGDLLFVRRSIPSDAKVQEDGVIVRGDFTGHRHRVKDVSKGVVLMADAVAYVRALKETEVVHEEHPSTILPPDEWGVIRQQEYRPAGWIQVAD
jgi:hypothetical protein